MYGKTWQGVQHENQNKQLHAVSFWYCNLINVVNNLHNLYGWAKEEFFIMFIDFILFDGCEQMLHNIIYYMASFVSGQDESNPKL